MHLPIEHLRELRGHAYDSDLATGVLDHESRRTASTVAENDLRSAVRRGGVGHVVAGSGASATMLRYSRAAPLFWDVLLGDNSHRVLDSRACSTIRDGVERLGRPECIDGASHDRIERHAMTLELEDPEDLLHRREGLMEWNYPRPREDTHECHRHGVEVPKCAAADRALRTVAVLYLS